MLADLTLLIAAYVIMRALEAIVGVTRGTLRDVLAGFLIFTALGVTLLAGTVAMVTLTRSAETNANLRALER